MAKAENGPLGPVKGKLGNLIFSSNLGTPYVRINTGTRKKGNTKEKNTRKAFTTMTWEFLDPLRPIIPISYKEVAKGKRTLQAAISYLNRYAMVRDTENNSTIVPSRMLMSRGSLGMSADVDVQVTQSPERELQFTWNPSSALNPYHNDDQVLLVAYNVEARAAVTAIGPDFRRDGSASLSLQNLPAGKVHVYLGFVSYDRSKASDSLYLGEVEIGLIGDYGLTPINWIKLGMVLYLHPLCTDRWRLKLQYENFTFSGPAPGRNPRKPRQALGGEFWQLLGRDLCWGECKVA